MRFLLLSLLLAAAAGSAAAQTAPKAAIVVGGHAFHPSFFRLFDTPEFQSQVQPHPSALGDELKNYDVLVLYDMLEELSGARRANLRAFLESGKGMVVLHHALIDYGGWKWWTEEVVGGRYFTRKSSYKHDMRIHMKPVGTHPIVRGIKPFDLLDETYKNFWTSSEVELLLETDHPDSDRPLAWIGPWKKSRVVVIQPGHGPQAFFDERYIRLVRNAILWAAGRLE